MIHGISRHSDVIANTIEEVKDKKAIPSVMKAIALGFVIGSRVVRDLNCGENEFGSIIGYNGKQSELYGGDCYPIIIHWDKFDPKQTTGIFEYALTDVYLHEVPGHLTPYCVHQVESGYPRLAVQDDISGDRPRAISMPFGLQKQFDHSGAIPIEKPPRWFGYVWAKSREEAVGKAREIMNNQ